MKKLYYIDSVLQATERFDRLTLLPISSEKLPKYLCFIFCFIIVKLCRMRVRRLE